MTKSTTPQGNRCEARLPQPDRQRLLALLKPVTLEFDQTLYESGGPIEHAYFSTGAVFSALTIMEDGDAIEVATVGLEGLVGHFDSSGGKISPHKVIVQIGGEGLRIEA